ncbi:TPA: DUF1566 domain-containing protein [Vibrio vulnificus]|nr:DUF1566 domain-containing protein [Vibrio vulnificus]HDY8207536.1 DUF1566 domain-containing protein [Vibrio vulnificus]
MLIVNNKWLLCIPLLLLAKNAQTSTLCAGTENIAIRSTTPTSEFTDNGDGTVTHHTTGLMWQRCSLGQSWEGQDCVGSAIVDRWPFAQRYARENTYANYSDWRLPNKNELLSIVELRCYQPAINKQIFPNTEVNGGYLSSSPYAHYSRLIWHVSFLDGVGSNNSYSNGHVRLVRDAR